MNEKPLVDKEYLLEESPPEKAVGHLRLFHTNHDIIKIVNYMVKTLTLRFLLIAFASFLFVGCRSYRMEVVKVKPYKKKDYITKILSVYEPKEALYPILDSIIIKTEECPEYQNRKEKVFFFFSIEKGTLFGVEEEWNNPLIGISANYYVFRISNFYSTKGVFAYKGYDFYINEISEYILLKETDKTTSITCIAPESYQFSAFYRGDRDMFWWYRYKHGTLVNEQYGYCPKQ